MRRPGPAEARAGGVTPEVDKLFHEVLSLAGFDVELVVADRPDPVRSMRGVGVHRRPAAAGLLTGRHATTNPGA